MNWSLFTLFNSYNKKKYLKLLANSWRKAWVKARPTTCAPITIIWARNLAYVTLIISMAILIRYSCLSSPNVAAVKPKMTAYHFMENNLNQSSFMI